MPRPPSTTAIGSAGWRSPGPAASSRGMATTTASRGRTCSSSTTTPSAAPTTSTPCGATPTATSAATPWGADQRDEAGEGDQAHAAQSVPVPLEEDDLLLAAAPDGLDEATAGRQLVGERRRHGGEGGGDDDGVEGRLFRQPVGPVPRDDLDVADPGGREVGAGGGGEVGPALDAPDRAGEVGQQRRLVAQAGADLEHGLATPQAEGRDHPRRQRRLRGDLVVSDGGGLVAWREADVLGGHE